MTSALTKRVGAQSLLYRLLETPEQVAAIQHLEAPVLARLIHHVGLEDSGELVALATTQQLARIFDEDLWRSQRPGQEERFDAERFGLWLEVMLEMGADRAAAKLAEMDEDFVTFALSQDVLVLDLDALALRQAGHGEGRLDDEALVDKALESSQSFELDRYLLVARRPEAWDAVLAVLVALDEQHHDLLTGLLERCCHLSSEDIEDHGGLYRVLTAAEQLESDVAQAREERREQEGHVAPQDASAFLALARSGRAGRDAITEAYFRSLAAAPVPSMAAAPAPAESSASLLPLLEEAQVLTPLAPIALLGAGEGERYVTPAPLVREGLAWLGVNDPGALSRCMQELGYLANVLRAGCSRGGRSLRALEAAQAAVAACNLGLQQQLDRGQQSPGPVLAAQGLVALFGAGWKTLHEDVVLWTARALVAVLARKAPGERGEAARVRLTLERDTAAGRPWASRKRLHAVAAFLSREALEAVRELMDECPTDRGAFLSTREQVEAARQRVRALL